MWNLPSLKQSQCRQNQRDHRIQITDPIFNLNHITSDEIAKINGIIWNQVLQGISNIILYIFHFILQASDLMSIMYRIGHSYSVS